MFKRMSFFSIFLMLGLALSPLNAKAEEKKVDYGNQVIVDSDLDGLTDEGEKQIFQTDPQQADSDSDGFKDMVEVLSETDPVNQTSFPGIAEKVEVAQQETPWAWYASRAAGLVAFALLYVSIFLGLTLRVPLLRKIFKPIYSMNIHCWISLQATILALIHGGVLVFDKFFNFSLADLFVPFASSYEPLLLPLGILAFYLMIMLVVTSYARKHISQKLWRITHFSNIVLYIIVLFHAAGLGTDLKNPTNFHIFLYANAFLVFLMLINMQLRIAERIRMRKKAALANQAKIGPGGSQEQQEG